MRGVPFAGMLVNELERAFSRSGFSFESRNIDNTDYMVSASYHRSADKVAVFLVGWVERSETQYGYAEHFETLGFAIRPLCPTYESLIIE